MQLEKFRDERGSSVVEFLFFGLLANVCILLASLQLGHLQHRQFVVQVVAKQITRAVVHDLKVDSIVSQASAIAKTFGFSADQILIDVQCEPKCDSEIEPGALVRVNANFEGQQASSIMRAPRN